MEWIHNGSVGTTITDVVMSGFAPGTKGSVTIRNSHSSQDLLYYDDAGTSYITIPPFATYGFEWKKTLKLKGTDVAVTYEILEYANA